LFEPTPPTNPGQTVKKRKQKRKKKNKKKKKIKNKEKPAETKPRKYVEEQLFTKNWWKNQLEEQVDSSKLISVATKLCKKYGVNPKIQLVNTLGNQQEDYAHFDFDKKVMKISKKATKDLKEFVISVLHEIDHARDLKKMGRKFIRDYEKQQNMIAQGFVKGKSDPYWDNPYEIKAEKFGRKEAKKYNIKKLFRESLNEVTAKTKLFKQKLMRRGITIRYDKAKAEKDLIQKYGKKGRIVRKKNLV